MGRHRQTWDDDADRDEQVGKHDAKLRNVVVINSALVVLANTAYVGDFVRGLAVVPVIGRHL
jgi:hypothetical protein